MSVLITSDFGCNSTSNAVPVGNVPDPANA